MRKKGKKKAVVKAVVRKSHKVKTLFVAASMIFPVSAITYQLTNIQVLQYKNLAGRGASQHITKLKLDFKRGTIYDRKKRILATSTTVKSVYAVPYLIEDAKKTAKTLSKLLDVKEETLVKRFTSKKKFVWVDRKVDEKLYKQVKELDIKGIDFLDETKRFYPKGELASHIIGFVNLDNKGMEGLELSHEKHLSGENGYCFVERDAAGRKILSRIKSEIKPVNGKDMVLTIDEVIQYIAETELDKAYTKYNAKGAMMVVMDAKTGEILALANRPTYDPNFYFDSKTENRRNRAVTDFFEPGSTMKTLSGAAVLDKEVVKLEDKFFCEHGAWRIGRRTLHDSHPYGNITFKQVIEKSSNIGTAKAVFLMGKDKLYDYLIDFGFGKKTGVGLLGEVSGLLSKPKRWSDIQTANISMGQGISVTSLQMVTAVNALGNGGNLLKPYIIKGVYGKEGEVIEENAPKILRKVISEKASYDMTEAMIGVVSRKGTARRAALKGFDVAGKTGTAQKVKPEGGYSHKDFIASFVGFVPAHDPVISVLVVVDTPKPMYYGGVVAAPVFRESAKAILKYMNVSPTKTEEEEKKIAA